MKLGKESNYFLNICSDFQNISISTNKNNIFENEIFSFSKEDLDFNSYFDVDRLPTLNINFENMPIKYENIDFSGSIDNINDFLIGSIENFPKNEALFKEYLNNKTFIRWNFYIYYISLKILVIVSLHPNFSYSEETGEDLNVFFDSINLVKSNFKTFLKIYKDGYLIPKISNDKISTNEYELVKLLKKYSKVISDNIIISNDDSNKIDFKKDNSIQNNILSENLENNIIIQSENNKKINIFSQKNNNSNFKYNIQENDRVQLFIQNSKYSEMKNCSEGKFDSISFFENHFDLIPFIDFISNKDKFLNIIQNYHNFLLLIIMLNMEDEEQENQLNHIFNFMPVFEILYKLNEILQLVDYTEFYNEYINKNVEVNFENECKYYLKYLEKDDKTKFCWLRYYWIFNAKSKSEILCEFNLKTKRDEFFNHYSNLNHPLLNNQNIGNALLIIEIKRNNMIEDSLNFLVNSQLNYKKHLKVKFKGEEGIDEGGVKKEYFLILVRQLFNPNYGMFTFSQKTRLFWFNPISFEAKIKFELIGIIFGLAFFNNVILDIKFPLVIYKKLLNIKPTLQDLKQIDAELYTNFNFLLNTKEKNLEELLGTTFTAIVDSYGEKQIIPLKVNFKKFNFLIFPISLMEKIYI